MATVNKDFKIKSGLVVEGTTATVNGYDVLTKKQDDQNYIVNLIGGTATSANEADKVVKRDGSGDFAAGVITADLVGDVTGTVSNISNHNTDSLSEGVNNLYFTNERVTDVVNNIAGLGLDYVAGQLDVQIGTGLNTSSNQIQIDRSTVDGWYDASGSATAAENSAKSYADSLINDGSTTSTNVWSAYKTSTEIGLAQSAAESYTDTAVSNLVDGAPQLLDTLNELAAAIADNPNYATDVANLVAGKQNTLTEGTGINIANDTISVDVFDIIGGNNSDYLPLSEKEGKIALYKPTLTNYTDTLYDTVGSASTAQTNAETFATNAINALDTDSVEEGIANRYFTDARAKDAVFGALVDPTTSNLTNIQITQNSYGGLDITAENGVADSTTSDLAEGSNLYFTDARAVSAIDNANITPTAVEINNYRKEEATQQYVANTSTVNVHGFSYPYESVKYLVRVVGWVGGVKQSQITEILMTVDGNDNIAMTEYGNVHTSTEPLATFSAQWVPADGQFKLTATTSVGGCEIIAAATMLSWAD